MKENKHLNMVLHVLGLSCVFGCILLTLYMFIEILIFRHVTFSESNIYIVIAETFLACYGLYYFLKNYVKLLKARLF